MALVEYDGRELDQTIQIEDGIRKTLRQSSRAVVSASVINTAYDLLDDDFMPVESTLTEKCEALAGKLGAQFSLVRDTVVFEKPRVC